MKLRVKYQRQSKTVDFTDNSLEAITLVEVKLKVATAFQLDNQEFDLSLNKKDALPDDATLSSIGIVSGDMLHIISDTISEVSPSGSEHHRIGVDMDVTQQVSDVSMTSVSQTTVETSSNKNDFLGKTHDEVECLTETPQINRCMLEPLVVRESTSVRVPVLLDQLYHSTTCGCIADAFWVVVHTLMIEAGFQPVETEEITQMPSSWKQSGFYRCSYTLRFSIASNDRSNSENASIPKYQTGDCSVVGVPLGSSMIIHGMAGSDSSFKTEQLQLKPSDHVNTLSSNVPEVYIALDRLSRLFKDTVCLPLENELSVVNGARSGQGFTTLPHEIKLRVLSFLDGVSLCRLAQTRSDMEDLCRERVVWRRVYLQEYGKPDDSSVSRNWYELFKEEFLRRKEMRKQHRVLMSRLDHDLWYGVPSRMMPRPDPRFPPHIIGGDYDVHPDYAAGGIPNPMGGLGNNTRRPGPILPNMGVPGPRINTDPFSLPGSSGGNLTGSPFASRGRGPQHSFW